MSSLSFKGTLPSLQGLSLEITITVPLNTMFCEIPQKMGPIRLTVLRLLETKKPTNRQICIKMESITENCLIRLYIKFKFRNMFNPSMM